MPSVWPGATRLPPPRLQRMADGSERSPFSTSGSMPVIMLAPASIAGGIPSSWSDNRHAWHLLQPRPASAARQEAAPQQQALQMASQTRLMAHRGSRATQWRCILSLFRAREEHAQLGRWQQPGHCLQPSTERMQRRASPRSTGAVKPSPWYECTRPPTRSRASSTVTSAPLRCNKPGHGSGRRRLKSRRVVMERRPGRPPCALAVATPGHVARAGT